MHEIKVQRTSHQAVDQGRDRELLAGDSWCRQGTAAGEMPGAFGLEVLDAGLASTRNWTRHYRRTVGTELNLSGLVAARP
jgi:hypothetical protein